MAECGCPLGPKDPACYCGCRPLCEGFVNSIGLKLLKTVAPCCGPAWRTCDMITCKDRPFSDQNVASRSSNGVIVLTFRPVKDVAQYKAAYGTWATSVQKSNAGVRAMFSFMDKKKENVAIQVSWYDTPEVLAGIAPDTDVNACYAGTEGAFGAVYGLRNDVTKEALKKLSGGVPYEYGTLPRGWMKSAPHKGFDPTLYPGPPMIWFSKRWVQPGRNPAIASAFAKVGDLQYYSAPAFLSAFEYTADDNPDQLWSLRWFNDYDMGHVAHFPKSLASFVPTRVLFTMIPELKGGLGAEFPVALSFSTKEDITKAIAYNGGNKAYDQHYWEDVIGPLPDMGKGLGVAVAQGAGPGSADMER